MSPLSQKLQQLLGPVIYQDVGMEVPDPLPMPGPPIKEGGAIEPKNTWSTDSSCQGQPPPWRVIDYQPIMDSIWMEDGSGQSSQWAELRTVWIIII